MTLEDHLPSGAVTFPDVDSLIEFAQTQDSVLVNPEYQTPPPDGSSKFIFTPWHQTEIAYAIHYSEPIFFRTMEAYQKWREKKVNDIVLEDTAVYLNSFVPLDLLASHLGVIEVLMPGNIQVYHQQENPIMEGTPLAEPAKITLYSVQNAPMQVFDRDMFPKITREPSFFTNPLDADKWQADYSRRMIEKSEIGATDVTVHKSTNGTPVDEGFGGDKKITSNGKPSTVTTSITDPNSVFGKLDYAEFIDPNGLPTFTATNDDPRLTGIVCHVIDNLEKHPSVNVVPVIDREGATYQTLDLGGQAINLRQYALSPFFHPEILKKLIRDGLQQTTAINQSLGSIISQAPLVTRIDGLEVSATQYLEDREIGKLGKYVYGNAIMQRTGMTRDVFEGMNSADVVVLMAPDELYDIVEHQPAYRMMRKLSLDDNSFVTSYEASLGHERKRLMSEFGRWTADRYGPNMMVGTDITESGIFDVKQPVQVDFDHMEYNLLQKEANLLLYQPEFNLSKNTIQTFKEEYARMHGINPSRKDYAIGDWVSCIEIQTTQVFNILNKAEKLTGFEREEAIKLAKFRRAAAEQAYDQLRTHYDSTNQIERMQALDRVNKAIDSTYRIRLGNLEPITIYVPNNATINDPVTV